MMSVPATALGEEWQLLPAAELGRSGSLDSLAEERGQRVLFIGGAMNAREISFLVADDYESVVTSAEDFMIKSGGSHEVGEAEVVPHWVPYPSGVVPARSSRGADQVTAPFRERRLATCPLRSTRSSEMYSQVVIRVVDAKAIFGGYCTAIHLSRKVDGRCFLGRRLRGPFQTRAAAAVTTACWLRRRR
jgi:hypothetical protein